MDPAIDFDDYCQKYHVTEREILADWIRFQKEYDKSTGKMAVVSLGAISKFAYHVCKKNYSLGEALDTAIVRDGRILLKKIEEWKRKKVIEEYTQLSDNMFAWSEYEPPWYRILLK